MDVCYMVRQSRDFEELRYSLRSLVNVAHGRVWVYGARPPWLSDEAVHVPIRQGSRQHVNTAAHLAAMARNRDLSPEWSWWHDDMFVIAPVAEVPRVWRCTWSDWLAGADERRQGPYGPEKTRATHAILERFGKLDGKVPARCYEMHVPMVMDRDALAAMVADVTAVDPDALVKVQKRSLYGNWIGYGGDQMPDVKVTGVGKKTVLPAGPFVSSSDVGFQHSAAGQAIQRLFPDPSPYERSQRVAVPDAVRLMAGHLGVR